MLLEIRLNTLKDVVDYFVIVESTRNFKGKHRKLTFNKEKFSIFEGKIMYHVYDNENFDKNNAMSNEKSQMEYITSIFRGKRAGNDKNIIIISDIN